MNCPNCNSELFKGNCIKCGYFDKKHQLDKTVSPTILSDLQKYLKNDYQTVVANLNNKTTFLLGFLYLAYRGYPFIASLLFTVDFYFIVSRTKNLIIIFILDRFIQAWILNYIYLYLVKRKIRKYKTKANGEELIAGAETRYPFLLFISIILVITYVLIITNIPNLLK